MVDLSSLSSSSSPVCSLFFSFLRAVSVKLIMYHIYRAIGQGWNAQKDVDYVVIAQKCKSTLMIRHILKIQPLKHHQYMRLVENIIERGDLDLLVHMNRDGSIAECSRSHFIVNFCVTAAKYGHLEILKWLREVRGHRDRRRETEGTHGDRDNETNECITISLLLTDWLSLVDGRTYNGRSEQVPEQRASRTVGLCQRSWTPMGNKQLNVNRYKPISKKKRREGKGCTQTREAPRDDNKERGIMCKRQETVLVPSSACQRALERVSDRVLAPVPSICVLEVQKERVIASTSAIISKSVDSGEIVNLTVGSHAQCGCCEIM